MGKGLLETDGVPRVDFVGLEQLGSEDFVNKGLSSDRWGREFHICGGEEGFGRFPFDVAVLFYDRQLWTPVSKPVGGCMESIMHCHYNNYRAFLIQAFKR